MNIIQINLIRTTRNLLIFVSLPLLIISFAFLNFLYKDYSFLQLSPIPLTSLSEDLSHLEIKTVSFDALGCRYIGTYRVTSRKYKNRLRNEALIDCGKYIIAASDRTSGVGTDQYITSSYEDLLSKDKPVVGNLRPLSDETLQAINEYHPTINKPLAPFKFIVADGFICLYILAGFTGIAPILVLYFAFRRIHLLTSNNWIRIINSKNSLSADYSVGQIESQLKAPKFSGKNFILLKDWLIYTGIIQFYVFEIKSIKSIAINDIRDYGFLITLANELSKKWFPSEVSVEVSVSFTDEMGKVKSKVIQYVELKHFKGLIPHLESSGIEVIKNQG
jgi:hypothetical protein